MEDGQVTAHYQCIGNPCVICGPTHIYQPPTFYNFPQNPLAKCPICEGRGTVPAGFYMRSETVANAGPEQCRLCAGLGAVR